MVDMKLVLGTGLKVMIAVESVLLKDVCMTVFEGRGGINWLRRGLRKERRKRGL